MLNEVIKRLEEVQFYYNPLNTRHSQSQRPGLCSSPVKPHPAPIFEREVVWLTRVGCAHPREPHHLPLFFLGGEWQLLISEPELQSPKITAQSVNVRRFLRYNGGNRSEPEEAT